MQNRNALLVGITLLFIAVVVVAPLKLVATWALTVVLLAVAGFLLAAGSIIASSPWAVLITPMNTMSLSRTQTVLWTVLICASFITVAFARLDSGVTALQALAFTVPDTLLGLIGVSLTSAVANSVVLGGKTNKPITAGQIEDTAKNTGVQPTDIKARGTLFGYASPAHASFMDIFEGDELGDAHTIDLGKIQMFFFTVVGAVVFLGAMYNQLKAGVPTSLPALPANLIVLMGMSHAGYVGNKLVNRTQPGSQPEATAGAGVGATSTQVLPSEAANQAKLPVVNG